MRIKAKDKHSFRALTKTGYMRREHFKSLKVNNARIKQYENLGYIKREVFRGEEGFKLTSEGHKFAKNELGLENHYHTQSFHHDIAIADKYFELTYAERETFKNETEIRLELEQKIEELKETDRDRAYELEQKLSDKSISCVDCVYKTVEGVVVGYEVTTANYTQEQIEAKIEFCEVMQIEYVQEDR